MVQYRRLTDEQKTKIICYSDEKIANREIARRLGCNESTVRRFLSSYRQSGNKEGRTYSGRPRILSRRNDAHLKHLCLKNRFLSASKLKEQLVAITKKDCSTSTIERRLKSMGLESCRPAKKPLLTAKMRSTRLEWCKNHANWASFNWENVIFSDECKINLMGADGGVKVRRRKGERYSNECVLPTVRHSPYVMIWGAITANGVGGILMLEESVNAAAYKNIINKGVVPTIEFLSQYSEDVIFQDDSAPCHRAASVST